MLKFAGLDTYVYRSPGSSVFSSASSLFTGSGGGGPTMDIIRYNIFPSADNIFYKPESVDQDGEHPTWVKQWAALANKKSAALSTLSAEKLDTEQDNKNGVDADELRDSVVQPPVIPGSKARSRSGTGRKLPTPPVKSGASTPTTPKSLPSPRGSDSGLNSPHGLKQQVIFDPRTGESRQVVGGAKTDDMNVANGMYGGFDSARSNASIDTNVLLQDTDFVVRAVAERSHTKDRRRGSSEIPGLRKASELFIPINNDSDSDASSTSAQVNGDELMAPRRKTPPAKFKKGYSLDSQNRPPRGPIKDQTFIKESSKPSALKHGRTGRRLDDYDHDVHSDDDHSIISNTSTDYSEAPSPRTQRRINKNKSPMTMTRPNRAFALRRARADAEVESPRTEKTGTAKGRPTSAGARPSSATRDRPVGGTRDLSKPARDLSRNRNGRDLSKNREASRSRESSRTRPGSARDSARTDISLGQEIVKKSRDNMQRAKSAGPGSGLSRSLRQPRTSTSSRTPEPKHDTKSKISQSRSSSRSSMTGLAVSGNNPKSQPTSRSNSPRSQEYSAWKRRKDYDPRKAAAEAKTAAREEARKQRSQSVDHQDIWRRVRGDGVTGNMSSVSSEADESMMSERLDDLDSEHAEEISRSYDTLMVSAIYTLSLKVKTQTDRLMEKMRDRNQLSDSPSPIDDLLNQTMDGGNQELAAALRNLRKTEHHLQIVDRNLFPGQGGDKILTGNGSPPDHQKYLKELERIRTEIAGFKPIDKPTPSIWKKRQVSKDSEESDPFGDDFF